jgi:uncharacterized membrane protein YGL010W
MERFLDRLLKNIVQEPLFLLVELANDMGLKKVHPEYFQGGLLIKLKTEQCFIQL